MEITKQKDVYICFDKRDERLVKLICDQLNYQGIGFHTSLELSRDKALSAQAKAIRNSRVVLFIATDYSYRSPFAAKELVYAFNHVPLERIVVYVADNSKLPESIEFTTHAKNIVKFSYSAVPEELISLICNLLGRGMKEYTASVSDLHLSQNYHYKRYWFLSLVCAAVGVLLAIIAGIHYSSFLLAGSIVLATAYLWWIYVTGTGIFEDYYFLTLWGKAKTVINIVLCVAGAVMLPISTWMGVQCRSGMVGLMWLGGSWCVIGFLMQTLGKASATITLARMPLANRQWLGKVYDYFLCFDEHDNEVAKRIIIELRRCGLTCITSNREYTKKNIHGCRGFLYIASSYSFANSFCREAVNYAFHNRRPILAYRVDHSTMPEDQQLAFSNSNVRDIDIHPIETTLMADVKEMLAKAKCSGVEIVSAFWNYIFLSVCTFIAMVAGIWVAWTMKSFMLFLTVLIGICWIRWRMIDDERRIKLIAYAIMGPLFLIAFPVLLTKEWEAPKTEGNKGWDFVFLKCLLVLLTSATPLCLWWWQQPSLQMSVGLFLLCTTIAIVLGSLYKHMSEENSTGKLSSDSIDEYFDVFISYSRKNTEDVDKICTFFDRKGISYFIDRQGIPGGSEFPLVLTDAILHSGVFLALVTPESRQSKFCEQEVRYALEHKKTEECCAYYLDKDFAEKTHGEYLKLGESDDFDRLGWQEKTENWEEDLIELLKDKLSKSTNYKTHQEQLNSKSAFVTFISVVGRFLFWLVKFLFYIIVLSLPVLVGLYFHLLWWGIGASLILAVIFFFNKVI